jgi:hypothetical protein
VLLELLELLALLELPGAPVASRSSSPERTWQLSGAAAKSSADASTKRPLESDP